MARKNFSTTTDDELDSVAGESPVGRRSADPAPMDARFLDLEDEAESPFLRGQKRVPVRRGVLPRKAADRIKSILLLLLVLGCAGFAAVTLYRYGIQSWRFQLDSSDNIEVLGAHNITRAQAIEPFASDIDRNIFFVPLAERKRELEQIPWVESASVLRLYPNRLRILVKERTPVAFVAIRSHIALIDGKGVIMDLPAGQQATYSFPVIVGMSEAEPLSTRTARMKIYAELIRQLDSGGTQYSRDLSDVDLSDPDDVKATVSDPHGAVLVHLGSTNFLERFRIYVTHVQEWRTQFLRLESVDLRYEHQVIVNPDSGRGESKASAPENKAIKPGSKAAAAHKKTAAQHKAKKHS